MHVPANHLIRLRSARLRAVLAGAALAAAMLGSPSAQASSPSGIIAYVDRVEYEPTGANPTKVRIYGAFSLWKNPPTGYDFEGPKVGYMYFVCPAGKEATCVKEWSDIGRARTDFGDACAIFGDESGNNGTVRALATTPTAPDLYPIDGMGVQPAQFALGHCAGLRTALAGSTTDAGPAVDGGGTSDGGAPDVKTDSNTPTTDSGSQPPSDGSTTTPPSDATSGADTRVNTVGSDGGRTTVAPRNDGGCAVGAAGPAPLALPLALSLLALVGLRRRSRRGR